ncbi:chorismate synthase [Candidatus Marsarchaeota G1 archaeon OSP_D]|jgi:chorismate synthase (EC 4.2.3.5)|uniref:Chorismate synthase n=2 Tax=Candidatus Marsarchaeota group 1 TaxID=2203770 RepID=A0A2R6ACY1_9ARCH|nr:MAG: chorismate synthase [Candidatus Marsarchaeota G1 archaeon OSP_D]PSN89366.1 MAG: chorismate synthase [Candidatus Marsarchaeota G1 archaeon OSP_C]
MACTLGERFRLTVFGESHGSGVGVVVDGCPPGFPLDLQRLQVDMDRRKPGQSLLTSLRKEEDKIEVLSGLYNGRTNGGPLTLFVRNTDVQSSSYSEVGIKPRPSHLDYTAHLRYKGYFDYRGGGFLSGRMTAAMVMGGGVAKQLLEQAGVEVHAYMKSIKHVTLPREPTLDEIRKNTYASAVRCPILETSPRMEEVVLEARKNGDSVGGVVEAIALGVPAGYGDPIFDSVESKLAHALFGIPAVKALEFGAGFGITQMYGSEANDQFRLIDGKIVTQTNNNGGILGGITNGMPIVLRVGFKPTASIPKPQKSVNLETLEEEEIVVKGRHDPCVAIRGVIVVENMVSAVLADVLYSVLEDLRFQNS